MSISRSFLALFIAVGVWLAPTLLAQAQVNIPSMGDDGAMTLGEERHLGDQIAKEIYRDPQYVSDPVLDAYLASVWQPLYAQAKRSGSLSPEMDAQFAWRMFLVRDKSVNAFALPGGYLGVHLGLLAVTQTPDELASVLAHETTHVTQRHIARGMSKEKAQTPLLVASILVGLLAMRSNVQLANAVLATGQASAIQGQLNYSRDFEREADRLGLTLMAPAGYDPRGFIDMFNMLGKASRLSDNGSYPYLRTHPLTTERMADMRTRVDELATGAGVGMTEPSSSPRRAMQSTPALLLHRMMAARAAVLADLGVEAQKTWMEQAQAMLMPSVNQSSHRQDADRLPVLYAAALAAWQTKDAVKARALYQELKNSTSIRTPSEVLTAVRWLGAELQVPSLTPPLDVMSNSRVELLYAAQQLLSKPAPTAAELKNLAARLQEWTSANPKDIDAWSLLSRVQQAQGLRIRSNMSAAESLRAQVDDSAALAQYQAAQNLIRQGAAVDPIDAAIVDSKVRQLEATTREASQPQRQR